MRGDGADEAAQGRRAVPQGVLQFLPVGTDVPPRQQATFRVRGDYSEHQLEVLGLDQGAVQGGLEEPGEQSNKVRYDVVEPTWRTREHGTNIRYNTAV